MRAKAAWRSRGHEAWTNAVNSSSGSLVVRTPHLLSGSGGPPWPSTCSDEARMVEVESNRRRMATGVRGWCQPYPDPGPGTPDRGRDRRFAGPMTTTAQERAPAATSPPCPDGSRRPGCCGHVPATTWRGCRSSPWRSSAAGPPSSRSAPHGGNSSSPSSWRWSTPRWRWWPTTWRTGRCSGGRQPSEVAGLVAGNLAIGMSYGWWMDRAHPSPRQSEPRGPRPRRGARDPDLDAGGHRGDGAGWLRFVNGLTRRTLFFPLLTLLGLGACRPE